MNKQDIQYHSNGNCKAVFVGALIIFLVTIFTFSSLKSHAKDFGIRGQVFKIKEKDAIEEIQEKLKNMQESGQIDEHNQLIKEKVTKRINKPSSLNLRRTEEEREFSYDPTIEVREDLKDIKGQVFQKAGTRVNPLDRVLLSYELIFFDADDDSQLDFALLRNQSAYIKPKLILTGGSPIEIEKAHGLDVYFDQGGVLVKRLGISQVPAIVAQDNKVLKIKEIKLEKLSGTKVN